MTQKIAVAIVHGIGNQKKEFADGMIEKLKKSFISKTNKKSVQEIVFEAVYWSPIVEDEEESLWMRVSYELELSFKKVREFMVHFVGDAIAYQPMELSINRKNSKYDKLHLEFSKTLKTLSEKAGPKAPLCIISHSLGSIIASNYMYDLQNNSSRKTLISKKLSKAIGKSELEKGDTLSLFYTLGSPLALWSLRYKNFGDPVKVPAPGLSKLFNEKVIALCKWVNYYDKDDIIAYPLRGLNDKYFAAVKEDAPINVGGPITSKTPLAHMYYWECNDVIEPIATTLAQLWKEVNNIS